MSGPLTFAIADLHGRDDLLAKALEAIAARAGDAPHTVVFLGDYIDRGPASRAVLERLRTGPLDAGRWICLKGNHEDMLAQASHDPDLMPWWLGNGGDRTLASYEGTHGMLGAHVAWVESLPRFHVDDHRIYVHAGLDPALPLADQSDKVLMWKRYPSGASGGYGHRHIVHGHDPHQSGPIFFEGRTALDTLAWRTGRLVVAVFEDARPGGPVDLIEVSSASPGS